jgi:diguanylate cyclase (GGDEF)-like protein
LKIRALGSGASDSITRPFDNGELIARIMVHLNIKALQDDMRNTNRLLKELAITDHLTRLYNRRYMMNVLEMELNRTLRKKGKLTLVIIDVDHFKCVNDTYGHQRGDIVLAEIADLIRSKLRNYDIAARYGGEEFAMLLPETALKDGILVAERVRSSVEQISFPPPMEGVGVTISLGVAALPAPHMNSVDALISAADEALYRAKQNGRNRVEAMSPFSTESTQDR